jgi:hypothetical protein
VIFRKIDSRSQRWIVVDEGLIPFWVALGQRIALKHARICSNRFRNISPHLRPDRITAPVVALTHRQRKERRRIATRSITVAAITLVVVALVGHLVLRLLGIGLPAFQIAGGLLLLLLSIDMVFARHSGIRSTTAAETEEAEDSTDVAMRTQKIFPRRNLLKADPRRELLRRHGDAEDGRCAKNKRTEENVEG